MSPSPEEAPSEPTGADRTAVEPVDRDTERLSRLELFAVLLMALTAVMTAWSAFEASKWGGVMSIKFSEASATRTESVRNSNLANRQVTVDVDLFSSYVDAVASDDDAEAAFFRDRFPERLAVAVDAWEELRPLEDPDAPGTPFEMEEYVVEPALTADRLEREADQRSTEARTANQNGDNYTITSVLFATVILLAALSSKVRTARTGLVLIALAVVVFVASVGIIATYPIEI
ncbi:hypothetical protein PO878_05405 [Iamia majanohamensis]|uniref:Uncharacterized protein n=1 Tax=Iamia majanohamensis TaxID=467976 RepID=A0AAE9Y7J2_9ACTN|nr:hypothetical protein [Iamia majanohamensis]WCO68160.1 hypothetical protein PO878_05405 [Iamia majanohamensis]